MIRRQWLLVTLAIALASCSSEPSPTQRLSPTQMPSSFTFVPRPAAEAESLADAITHVYGRAPWYGALVQRAGRPDVQVSISESKKTFTVHFTRLDDKKLARTICGQVAALVPMVASGILLSAQGLVVAQCPGTKQ